MYKNNFLRNLVEHNEKQGKRNLNWQIIQQSKPNHVITMSQIRQSVVAYLFNDNDFLTTWDEVTKIFTYEEMRWNNNNEDEIGDLECL
jgi:hypothetical protein